ncbi:hypothetical protein SDC9_93817 [bioreactor metagenome]|uniref:Uncharacterized protein n=1 Tax=bioreactor metagenome TaxID=1076179 RepID=A0A645A1M7_9ZZZZ
MSTPPASCKASKSSTWCPMRARSAAQVRPAGPEPMTATLLPVRAAICGLGSSWCSDQSATKRSRRPMATERPLMPRVHFASHWLSCGQTRPQMAGRLLLDLMIFAASSRSPSRKARMNWLMGTCTGQPCTQGEFLHWMQRAASFMAVSRS